MREEIELEFNYYDSTEKVKLYLSDLTEEDLEEEKELEEEIDKLKRDYMSLHLELVELEGEVDRLTKINNNYKKTLTGIIERGW